MTKDDAAKIIDAYDALCVQVFGIVSDIPFYAPVDGDNFISLAIDGDDVVLSWKEYESDYYGGGYMNDQNARFPASALALSNADLKALRTRLKKEERERQQKLRAAQQAVARDRAEAHDRAEFARLKAKYEHRRD